MTRCVTECVTCYIQHAYTADAAVNMTTTDAVHTQQPRSTINNNNNTNNMYVCIGNRLVFDFESRLLLYDTQWTIQKVRSS